jgi:Na+/melibiose symporter-like transporter
MHAMPARLSRAQRVSYAAGSLGTGGFSTVPGLLLLFYLTDTLGVAAGVAGLIVLGPKIVDVVLNPVLGSLSDRTMQRTGSRRPWLLVGGIGLPVAFAVTFAAPAGLSGPAAAAWVALGFLTCVVAFAAFQVSYLVMPAEITDDYSERTDLMSWRIAFLSLAILLFGAGAPALVQAGGTGRRGYLVMGVVVGAVLAVAMLGTWRGTRSMPIRSAAVREPTVAERFQAVRENRPFAVLLSAFVVQALATGTMLAALVYVATYLLGGSGRTSILFGCFIGPALLVMPGWRWLGRRYGKRFGYLLSSAIFLVACAALISVRSLPGWAVFGIVGSVGVAYAGLQMFPLAMLPDVLALDAAVSGQQRAGVFTGVWTAGETTGFALGPGLVGLALGSAGFVSTASGPPAAQPASALTAIVLVFSVVPAVLAAVSIPLIRRYDLTADRLDLLLSKGDQ